MAARSPAATEESWETSRTFESLVVTINVKVEEPEGTEASLPNEATVQGGGASTPPAETRELTVSGASTPFGISRFELVPEEEGGGRASQAGSHPFQITNSLDLNLTREEWPGLGLLPSLPALSHLAALDVLRPNRYAVDPARSHRIRHSAFGIRRRGEQRSPAVENRYRQLQMGI